MALNNIETYRLKDGNKIDNLPSDTINELSLKVDKVNGKSLIDDTKITKLDGIEAGAEVNITENVTAGTNITIDRVGKDITISSTATGGATTLDELTDVTITTPATGQALTYNGTIWVNTTPAGGGDMLKSIYDPQNIEDDAFDRANHTGTQAISTITANGNALSWSTDDNTINIPLNAQVTLQAGQEILWQGRNNTGSVIPNGTVVYATGTIGASGRITIAPYIADGSISGIYTLGIATQDVAIDGDGFITHFGKVRGIDTSLFTEGTVLYASATIAGGLTSTAPNYPQVRLPLAFVINSHGTNGTIAVRVPSVDNEVVHKTGSETIAGTKTFSSAIVGNITGNAGTVTTNANLSGAITSIGNETSLGSFTASELNSALSDADIATGGGTATGTNTGDNAPNSLYSGLDASKQDVLVSGTNIKTINGTSILGSGDIIISGGGSGLTAYDGVIAGELTTGTIFEIGFASAKTLSKFKCSLKTLPTGADFIIKAYKNGVEDASVTIATTASATNGLYVSDDTTFVSGSFTENDRLTITITQVGSTLAGTNLAWQII